MATRPTTTEATTTTTTTEASTTRPMATRPTTTEATAPESGAPGSTFEPNRTTTELGKRRKKREVDSDESQESKEMESSLEEILAHEENLFDEEEMEEEDNRTDSDEESGEDGEDEQDSTESGERKKRYVRRWKPKKKSIGYYGLFQLSDSYFCDSGYRWSRNRCQTSCSVLGCSVAEGRIVSKCELKVKLTDKLGDQAEKNGMDVDKFITNIVCHVEYASGFNTSAVNELTIPNTVWTLYGLFQLSNHLVCNDGTTKMPNICGMDCNELIDDNIEDDLACLVILFKHCVIELIYQCKGAEPSEYFKECAA
ncbi:Lysozyme C [Nibea albiflora]|uniref:Lysozyme C n=1 Tax=Nibea albiflora TaxID=240163 RepID=A0ACB7FJR8_NIBAL|nr:Lysozyme C [Nibea albiflora]